MTRSLLLAAAMLAAPFAANAMPEIGDVVGTNPADATAALSEAGCVVDEFEAEDGKIEAKCTDDAGEHHEVYIDPASGAVTKIKAED